jgi:predicted O-methyltransferase YrrM
MNSFLTQIAFQIQDIAVRPFVYTAIQSLEKTNDGYAGLLAESIRDAFKGSLSEDEKKKIHTIENLRKRLNKSNDVVEISDFGANADSMNGTIVHRSIGEVAVSSSKPYRWSLLLFFIIERFAPKQCLEFGTCLGVSTLYQAAALTLNGSGALVTMEGAPNLASLAQKNFSSLAYENITSVVGKFSDILPSVIEKYQPFDYVFVDGHHEGNATYGYFEQLLPSLMNNAIVVFDDIHWSASMKEAWQKIIRHKRVKYFVDLYQVGILIVS